MEEAGGEWDTFAEQIELVCTSLKVTLEIIQFSCLGSVSCSLFHPTQTETRFVFSKIRSWPGRCTKARNLRNFLQQGTFWSTTSAPVNIGLIVESFVQHRIAMKVFDFFSPTPLPAFKEWGEKYGGNVLRCVKSIIDKKGLCRAATHLPPNLLKSRKNSSLPAAVFGLGPKLRAALQEAAGWSRSGRSHAMWLT